MLLSFSPRYGAVAVRVTQKNLCTPIHHQTNISIENENQRNVRKRTKRDENKHMLDYECFVWQNKNECEIFSSLSEQLHVLCSKQNGNEIESHVKRDRGKYRLRVKTHKFKSNNGFECFVFLLHDLMKCSAFCVIEFMAGMGSVRSIHTRWIYFDLCALSISKNTIQFFISFFDSIF